MRVATVFPLLALLMTIRSRTTLGAAIGALVLLGSAATAQVSFSGGPQFYAAPDLYDTPALGYMQGLNGNFGGPGTGVFVHNEVISSIADGFKLSQATFTYTTTSDDIGQDLYLGWKVFRMAQVAQGGGGTNVVFATAGLDGTLTATSGAGVVSLFQDTTYLGQISGGQADQFFDASGFVFDGITANAFSASSSAYQTVHYGTSLLQQTFYMLFHPTAEGEVISLSLPDSSESHLSQAPVATPEPGTMALMGGLAATGMLGLIRRRRSARA